MAEARIKNESIQVAADYLVADAASKAAVAKAMLHRKKHAAATVFSKVFLAAEGTVEARKHKAQVSQEYQDAEEAVAQAIEENEYHSKQHSNSSAILDFARTQMASIRDTVGKLR